MSHPDNVLVKKGTLKILYASRTGIRIYPQEKDEAPNAISCTAWFDDYTEIKELRIPIEDYKYLSKFNEIKGEFHIYNKPNHQGPWLISSKIDGNWYGSAHDFFEAYVIRAKECYKDFRTFWYVAMGLLALLTWYLMSDFFYDKDKFFVFPLIFLIGTFVGGYKSFLIDKPAAVREANKGLKINASYNNKPFPKA